MDCFIQNLLRDKWLSVEGNNFDNNTDEVVIDSIEDGDSDCLPLPVLSDNDIISSMNIKEKLIDVTITDPNADADVGTDGESSISPHRRRRRRRRHLFVSLVSDNAVFAEGRSCAFRRTEDNEKQIDRWDANHGIHDNYNENNDKINDSRRLVIPQERSWKQQQRDSMLAIPKRTLSVDRLMSLVITDKKEEEDEGHINDNSDDDNKHKHKNGTIVTTNKKKIPEHLQAFPWDDKTKTKNRNTKSNFGIPTSFAKLLALAA
jgi:hypothetical protein